MLNTAKRDLVKRILKLKKGTKVFSQGIRADAIYLVQTGKVQLTVVSDFGREAVLRVLGASDFFGEECLVAGSLRTSTAITLKPSTLFRIEKLVMREALHRQPEFCRKFVASLLARSVNLEQHLHDELLNHTEKRLARVLLKLARGGPQHQKLPDATGVRVTHAVLAEILGVSRSRINVLLKKFRTLGLIDYKGSGSITVRAERLTDVILAST